METVFVLLTVQAVMGAYDNIWHHEIKERLPSRVSAKSEMTLHMLRGAIYAVIFGGLAWFEWRGIWVWVLGFLLIIEIIITIADFLVEDETRKLPKLERILHTLLAINYGVALAFLVPVMHTWCHQETALLFKSYGIWSWVMTVFSVGVFGWFIRDFLAVVNLTIRSIPTWQRKPIGATSKASPLNILVTGATGFIGNHLVRALIHRGENVTVLARDREKADDLFGPHVKVVTDIAEIDSKENLYAIINLAGAPIAGWLWTADRRKLLVESRIQTTENLIDLVQRLDSKPEVLISGSAIGYYGAREDEDVTEDGSSQNIFMSQLCEQWEQTALKAEQFGVRTCLLRTGLVLGADGGIFHQLSLTAKFGLGMVMGSGRQWISWIHIDDMIGLIKFALIDNRVQGAINAVAPNPVRQGDFISAIARAHDRPVWLRMPEYPIRLVLGELATLFVDGQKVLPGALTRLRFVFQHPEVNAATREIAAAQRTGFPQSVDLASSRYTVYFNASCPVCSKEISVYERHAKNENALLSFVDVHSAATRLKAFGLGPDVMKRRLHIQDEKRNLYAGTDAFIVLWSLLPRFRILARLIRLPGVYPIAVAVYEGVLAPLLTRRTRVFRPKSQGKSFSRKKVKVVS